MKSRAQTPLVRVRSHSENLLFQLCEQMQTEKERQTTKQKTAGQALTYNSNEFSLTQQKIGHRTGYN